MPGELKHAKADSSLSQECMQEYSELLAARPAICQASHAANIVQKKSCGKVNFMYTSQ